MAFRFLFHPFTSRPDLASSLLLASSATLGLGLLTIPPHSPFSLRRHTKLFPATALLTCDASAPIATSPRDWSYGRYEDEARVPVTKDGRVNAAIFKQISAGSVAGLLGGVAVSLFSRPLALLIGLMVFGFTFLESNGIHLIPYNLMQRYFTNINLRSAVQDNVAFKLSFGATFALAAFAEF